MAAANKQAGYISPTPGGAKRGVGRPKGRSNDATLAAREAIGQFVDGNASKLQHWLDAVAKTDPAKAFTLFQSVIEYHVPKLGRTELTGAGGGAVMVLRVDDKDERA